MLKYFLPDWEDRLDPHYDFRRDEFSDLYKQSPYEAGCYAHQLFDRPPYDGMLFSLYNLVSPHYDGFMTNRFDPEGAPVMRGRSNIRDYLKLKDHQRLEVMGDCGAFGYVNCEVPPPHFSVSKVAQLYDRLGFDIGVSVDHLIVDYVVKENGAGRKIRNDLSRWEKEQRVKLTRRNAKEFFKEWKRCGYAFRPIGVAQGYDVKTYKESVKHLLDVGYDYVALGSLVKQDSGFIIELLEAVEPLTIGIDLHLFGVLRPRELSTFKRLGVTSFDSASYLRKAWLRSGQNYLGCNGKWYAAIRVPQSTNKALIKNADTNGFSEEDIKKMEKDVMEILKEYEAEHANIVDVLESVKRYDSLLLRDSEDIETISKRYRLTLEERPWEDCDCNVCRSIGIDAVIFRGTNRNKRRGFHNIYTFREQNKDILR